MSLVFQKRRKKLTCQIVREFFIKNMKNEEKVRWELKALRDCCKKLRFHLHGKNNLNNDLEKKVVFFI